MKLIIFLFNFYIWSNIEAAKILIYSPSYSNSHIISNGRIADVLAKDGHEVVLFIPEYDSSSKLNGTKSAKIIRMDNIGSYFEDYMGNWGSDMGIPASVAQRMGFEDAVAKQCEALMERRAELEALKKYKFDIAFSEMVELCGIGMIHYLGIKNHIWLSTTPLHDHNAYNLGVPSPISYVPLVEENPLQPVMNFWERAMNFYMYLSFLRIHWHGDKMETAVFRKHVDPNFPYLSELGSRSALCFVNSDEFFDMARPILHKTVYIGGLGISEPKPLKEPYNSWMSKGKNGVIMFSLGSLVPLSTLKLETKVELFDAFKSFVDYHFIVKIDSDDEETKNLANKYSNIDVTSWLPQSDMLGHPRVQMFITHAGINGILESILRGVPLITIPMFADQFRNGKVAEYREVGYYLSKSDLNGKNIKKAVESVLENKKYKQNAVRLSQLIKDKPFKPEENLRKWVNFVAKHGSLPELEPEGAHMNFVEYFCLDVIGAFVLVSIISIYVIYKLFSLLLGLLFFRKSEILETKKIE